MYLPSQWQCPTRASNLPQGHRLDASIWHTLLQEILTFENMDIRMDPKASEKPATLKGTKSKGTFLDRRMTRSQAVEESPDFGLWRGLFLVQLPVQATGLFSPTVLVGLGIGLPSAPCSLSQLSGLHTRSHRAKIEPKHEFALVQGLRNGICAYHNAFLPCQWREHFFGI